MSFVTYDIDDFYWLIGVLYSQGFDLDFDYMKTYHDMNKDAYLIKVRGD